MNFKAGVNFEMLSVASLPSDFQELCREVSTQLAFNFASRRLARSVRYWRVGGRRPCLLIWDTELKGQGGATRALFLKESCTVMAGSTRAGLWMCTQSCSLAYNPRIGH